MRFRRETKPSEGSSEEVFVSKRAPRTPSSNKKPVRNPSELNSLVNKTVSDGGKFSWRANQSINNLEQQKKQEVDREIKEKTKLIKHRRNMKVTLRLAIFLLAVGSIYFSLCYFSKRSNLSIEGIDNNSTYAGSLQKDTSKAVGGGVVGNFKPSFNRYKDIETALKRSRADVDSAQLKFNLFRLRTDVTVQINKPIIKWVSAEGKVSYVDQKGRIYNPPEELVKFYNPLEIGGAGLGSEAGSRIPVSPERLAWIAKLVPKLREGGVEAAKVNVVVDSLKGVEVLLAGKETRLLFSTDEDPARSGISATKSIKYLEQSREGGLTGIAYIDVRTPDRVLYK